MKHKDKVKLARKMHANGKYPKWVSIWDTPEWNARHDAIVARVTRKQSEAHKRAMMREEHRRSTGLIMS